jgi:mannosylfructose-phosphate synthase
MNGSNGHPKRLHRICFLNPHGYVQYPPPLGKTDTGGQTVYEFELAQALAKKGIKVDIVTRQFGNMPQEEQVWENVKIVRIPCGPKTFVPKEKLYEYIPEMAENFMHYIEKKQKKYNLVHSHYWDGGYLGLLMAKKLNVPHVHTPHSLGKLKQQRMNVEDLPPQKLKRAYRYHVRIAVEQKILNKASMIITICETNRILMLEHYIVDFEKIQVIYPGIDVKNFNPNPSKVDEKIKLKKNAIITVSRMASAKGLDRVIDALSLIKRKVDFHYYLCGGSFEDVKSAEEKETELQLHELVRKYRLQDRITFVKHIDHTTVLPAYYRNADIFVLASRFEPFGLTTLEAMACKATPIVSHVAGSKEVIIDGLNGFIVDTHNRKELSELILKLLKNRKIREKVSDNAAFTIKEHYAWDKIVDRFLILYKSLL